MSTSNPDVIVIGAGHNGLAAGALLARQGLRVVVLEKNRFVGGMAGTREILSGCRNDVGASLLFPLAKGLYEALEFERYGVELLELPIMSVTIADPGDPAVPFYANPLRMAFNVWRQCGTRALIGFARLVAFTRYPAQAIARYRSGTAPKDLETLLAEAPDAAKREALELTFRGSAMDLIDRFFPDEERHRPLRAQLAFAAVQSTYLGPYSPGSAFCLVYTLSPNDAGGLMKRVRGGIGSLSEALRRSIEDKGGEVRLGANVQQILVEDGRAAGVVLRGGETLRARFVLSNLDKTATLRRLVDESHVPEPTRRAIDAIDHRGAYVHMLLKLNGLPRFAPAYEALNADPRTRFSIGHFTNPRELQHSYEACVAGNLPTHPPVAMQIPTVIDPSLAPEGQHLATIYGFYFPCDAPKDQRGKLRDEMKEQIINRLELVYPGLRQQIVEAAIFSSDHFATMQGATGGDFTHGLIHADQMLGARALVPGSAHETPIPGLYLCGAACHPGPGVTFLPGAGCAAEIAKALGQRPVYAPADGGMSVETERRDRILVIRLAREAKRNALDASITAGLDAAMNRLEDDPELWCGVLTGGPRFFSAGADLASGPGEPTPRGGLVGLIERQRSKPLIAAVEGHALGGGMELVLCCDLVVAARDARFGLPEPKRGLMPDFGGAFRVARMLPANVAREQLLTADDLSAERAERLGFVNRLTEPGAALEGALALAERICANAPQAVREALAIVNAEIAGEDEGETWERSHAAHARLLQTEDVREGITAFFEKRPPVWRRQ